MTQEDKLKEARKLYETANKDQKYVLEKLFPELIESEDERIRESLLKYLHTLPNHYAHSGVCAPEWIAWLEKQGEQPKKVSIWKHWSGNGIAGNGEGKPICLIKYGHTYSLSSCLGLECDYIELSELDKLLSEKQDEQEEPQVYETEDGEVITYSESEGYKVVKPKFHEGEWVVRGKTIAQILDVQEQYYVGLDIDGNDFTSSRFLSGDKIHLYTIQDAKDGDVLSDGTTIFIFKDLLSDGSVMSYCDYDINSGESDAFCPLSVNLMCSKITPATKEQRDQLEKAMADVGYEWDAEKKELKKIEQKPAWSEEDEKMLHNIIKDVMILHNSKTIDGLKCKVNWLKSLKNRYTWKPSDEQIQCLYDAVEHYQTNGYPATKLKELYEQMQKIYKL